tara:strand:- start:598 stop:945 length:348 start_codon:yes stop_codon:yes gene_type:complete
MDEKLKEALEYSDYMVTYNNQKRILKNKFLDQNVYYASGTRFAVNKEFITFINLLLQKGQTKDVTIIDDNDNPVQIANFEKFVEDVMDLYAKNVNDYYNSVQQIKKRDIKDVLDA